MRVLITGGSGFIGSLLIKDLLEKYDQCSIINVDVKEPLIKNKNLEFIKGDITDGSFLEKIDNINFDICIHLAALCKEPGFEWSEYFLVNHEGTKNVINLCERLEVKNIIFTSTMMVYKAGEILRIESSPTEPDTAYGISKLLAEKELEIWVNQNKEARTLKIIRPAVVFGENENANFTRLYYTLKKGFFPYVGKSNTIKSNVYVKELNRFIIFLLDNSTKEEVYNFSFPEEYSIKKIVETFKSIFGFKTITPTLSFKLLKVTSYLFELLNSFGLRNSIHHRRIEKLYYSTNIYPENAIKEGYSFNYDLTSALSDWKKTGDLTE